MPKTPTRKTTTASPRKGVRRSVPTSPTLPAAPAADLAPVETLQQQADGLGLLDPLDVEPANIFFPDESDK